LTNTGTYIESYTQVKNYQLTKDEIITYSAALLKIETLKEEWKFVGQNMAIDISVKADVDISKIKNQLLAITQDKSVQNKIKAQQRKLEELERKFINLQNKLSSADSSEALILRKETNVVFKEIDSIQAKKITITSQIKTKTKNVLDYIELEMTQAEVKSLVGSPRSTDDCGYNLVNWNYGNVWVVFESGVVSCIVRSTSFSNCRDRGSYKRNLKQNRSDIKTPMEIMKVFLANKSLQTKRLITAFLHTS